MVDQAATLELGEILGSSAELVEAATDGVASGLGALRTELAIPNRSAVAARTRAGGPDADLFPASLLIGESRLPLGHHALAWAIAAVKGGWAPPNSTEEVDAQLAELDADAVRAIMHQATRTIASRQPAILLGHSEAAALAAECDCSDEARILELARRLLDVRISLRDREALGDAARDGDTPLDDAAEQLIARLRAPELTVLLDPELLRSITIATDDETGRGHFRVLRDAMFNELGVVLPPIRLRPASDLPAGLASLVFNDLPTETFRVPSPSETLVAGEPWTDDPAAVRTRNIASNWPAHVVAIDRVPADWRTSWSGFEYVILALAHLVRQHGFVLMDMGAAAERLEALRGQFPELASALSDVCPLPRFSLLLRSLLRSRVSIADLTMIAQAAVDRPDAPEPLVRRRLAPTATSRLASQTNTVVAYLLAPEIERSLVGGPAEPWLPPDEPTTSGLRSALARELRTMTASSVYPCVLTQDSTRPAAAAALRASHPDMIVTSFGELPAWINVYPVARLTSNYPPGEQ